MAVASWGTPRARSSNLASTGLDSLANGSESGQTTYDNSANKDLYGAVTVKLGSITSVAGGLIRLRVNINDGTDTANRAGGDMYPCELVSGASAKVAIFPMVRLYPFSMRISVINDSGVSLAASGNEFYVTGYGEASA